jgi:hypothetical protein
MSLKWLGWGAILLGLIAGAPVSAQTATLNALGEAPAWSALSRQQQQVLAPLAPKWATMDDTSRGKWASVADRYHRLSPQEQQRIDNRLASWAKMDPIQRGEARARFQQAQGLSAQERQRRWEAYQALPEQEREDLARQAQRRSQPVYLRDNVAGPREAPQQEDWRRRNERQTDIRKVNTVPTVAPAPRVSGRVVTPTTVKASRGATTRLVNAPASPALHQQAGLPKITSTDGFVDPVTMLPRRGAQSTRMVTTPSARKP